MKKKLLLAALLTAAACLLTACGSSSASPAASSAPKGGNPMKINVTDGTHHVRYVLNDSSAAKALYEMLPLDAKVENYSSNEKIFYPQAKMTGKGPEQGGHAGDLGYFSPWGNIVMYYGDYSQYPGLYILGKAESGTEEVGKLSGMLHVERADSR